MFINNNVWEELGRNEDALNFISNKKASYRAPGFLNNFLTGYRAKQIIEKRGNQNRKGRQMRTGVRRLQ